MTSCVDPTRKTTTDHGPQEEENPPERVQKKSQQPWRQWVDAAPAPGECECGQQETGHSSNICPGYTGEPIEADILLLQTYLGRRRPGTMEKLGNCKYSFKERPSFDLTTVFSSKDSSSSSSSSKLDKQLPCDVSFSDRRPSLTSSLSFGNNQPSALVFPLAACSVTFL